MIAGWTLDIAREQSFSATQLIDLARRSKAAGYDVLGLYLEHRYASPSAPWAAGPGCLTPRDVSEIRTALRASSGGSAIRLMPLLNTLGHMEGFIRASGGEWLAEGPSAGSLQMCPSRPECVAFARGLVTDALAAFDEEWIHVGGDETRLLGLCPLCAERAQKLGGPGELYADYFAGLCEWLLSQGRRPCLWGDMLLKHPEALERIPRQTLIFDWQYFQRPRESTAFFRTRGFDVVCCPSIQSYNSGWCYLDATQEIIDAHVEDARALGALGVFITTWEFSYFSQLEGLIPLILAAGERIAHATGWRDALLKSSDEQYVRAAELLGNELPRAATFLRRGTWRQLRDALVIRQNPFHLWRKWREEACGPAGDVVIRIADEVRAIPVTGPLGTSLHFSALLHRAAVEWVRAVERAATYFSARSGEMAVREIEQSRAILEQLRPGLLAAAAAGGSTADLARLDRLQEKCTAAAQRIAALDPSSAYWPSFSSIAHDGYIRGDQAGWRSGDPYEPPRSDVGE